MSGALRAIRWVVDKSVLKRKSSPQMCFAHLLKGRRISYQYDWKLECVMGPISDTILCYRKKKPSHKRESLVTKLLKYSNVTVI